MWRKLLVLIPYFTLTLLSLFEVKVESSFLANHAKSLADLSANDPFAQGPSNISGAHAGEQLTCPAAGVPCNAANCSYLDWWTTENRTVGVTPFQQFVNLTSDPASCFRRCQDYPANCTAFSFNPSTGNCSLFSSFLFSQVTPGPTADGSFSLYIRLGPFPPAVVLNEWIVTRDRRPAEPGYETIDMSRNNPKYVNVNVSWVTCLEVCAHSLENMDNPTTTSTVSNNNTNNSVSSCIAATFDLSSKSCSLYGDSNVPAQVEPGIIAMTHISVFADEEAGDYRFSGIGKLEPNDPEGLLDVESFSVESVDDCLGACGEVGWNCSVATIRRIRSTGDNDDDDDENRMECDIYRDPPKSFLFDPNSFNQSYQFTVQPANSLIQKLPSYATVRGKPLVQFPARALNECWGKALRLPNVTTWLYLVFDANLTLCSLYPPQIQGLQVTPNLNRNESNHHLVTFAKSLPTYNPDYYNYDYFWVQPESVTFPLGTPTFSGIGSGPGSGQILPRPPASSLHECLSTCTTNAGIDGRVCSGVIHRAEDGQCALVNPGQMNAIYNRRRNGTTGTSASANGTNGESPVQSWQVFVRVRNLTFLTNTKDIYSCMSQPGYNQQFSTTNQSNPLVNQGQLDLFENSLVNNINEWLKPHGPNFGGAPQSNLAHGGLFEQQTTQGPEPATNNPGITMTTTNSFRTITNNKSIINLKAPGNNLVGSTMRQKDAVGIWPNDIGTGILPEIQSWEQLEAHILDLGHELGSVLEAGISSLESGVSSLWNAASPLWTRVRGLFRLRLGFLGLFSWVAGNVGYRACHLYKWRFCEEHLPKEEGCEVKCGIIPASSRLLPMIQEKVSRVVVGASLPLETCKENPKMKVSLQVDHNKNKTLSLSPWLDTVKAPIPPTTCVCTTDPYPHKGAGSRGGLKEPDVSNPDLQDSCVPTKLSDVCSICCAVGYTNKLPGPKCTCENKLAKWKPKQGQCLKQNDCTAGTRTWSTGSGTSTSPSQTQEITRIPVRNCRGAVYYGVAFQFNRKIPLYTMYKFEHEDNSTQWSTDFSFSPFPCTDKKIDKAQLDDKFYKATNKQFQRGHLTPNADMRKYRDMQKSTWFFINAAPQDAYTNNQWGNLEAPIRKLLKTEPAVGDGTTRPPRSGWIITGTCYDDSATATSTPSCFWKIVCTVNDKLETVVAAFRANNSATTTQAEKDDRLKDMKRILNQQDLLGEGKGLGPITLQELWEEEFPEFFGKSNLAEFTKCKDAKKIDFPDIGVPSPKQNPDPFELFHWWNRSLFGNESLFTEVPISSLGRPPACPKKVVGYVTSWSNVAFTMTAASYLTHAILAFVQMNADGSLVLGSPDLAHSTNLDLDRQKTYARMYELRNAKLASGGRLKTLFAVGGWENSQYFSSVIASDTLTQNFISSALDILDYFNMDGIDVDFEYPVTGGAHNGTVADRANYVRFLRTLRSRLDSHAQSKGRSPYLLTIAGAAGIWVLEPGFDLPGITSVVDWINVMTYDYFGAWDSQWGGYTGPIAPLYYGAPPNYSGKLNVDFTMKKYLCNITNPDKLVMGLGFYGRFWNNSGSPVNGSNSPLWRRATPNAAGKFDGGYLPYRDIASGYLNNGQYTKTFHQPTQTPFMYQSATSGGLLLAYEDPRSIATKVRYAASKGFAGIMLWAVDLDDNANSMLRTASSRALCQTPQSQPYKCPPNTGKRWWTLESSQPQFAGMCGKSAPLYQGFYPVCDPEDPGYGCCSAAGYCGSGENFCNCTGCVDYYSNPELILQEPIRPAGPVRWLTLDKLVPGQPSCGYNATSLMHDGSYPICNPDSANAHCCSLGSYCGSGAEFCDCPECHDFKKEPNFKFPPKTWIDSGPDAGKCGNDAPRVNGQIATCNPLSSEYHCCSGSGFCGNGPDFCTCSGCVDFSQSRRL